MLAKMDLSAVICAVFLALLQNARCQTGKYVNLTTPASTTGADSTRHPRTTAPAGTTAASSVEPLKQRILKTQSNSPPPITPLTLPQLAMQTTPNPMLTISSTSSPCFMSCDLPAGAGTVSQYINPTGLPMERVVVYMYALPDERNPQMKKYYLYVPSAEKQRAIPDLPLHTADIITEASVIDVPVFMSGNPDVISEVSFPARPVYIPSLPLQPAPFPILQAPPPNGVQILELPSSSSLRMSASTIGLPSKSAQIVPYPNPGGVKFSPVYEETIVTPNPLPYPGSKLYPSPYAEAGLYPGPGPYPGGFPIPVPVPGQGPYPGSASNPYPIPNSPSQVIPSELPVSSANPTDMVMVYFPGDNTIPAGYYLVPNNKALWPPGYRPNQVLTGQLPVTTPSPLAPFGKGYLNPPGNSAFGEVRLPGDYLKIEKWVLEYLKNLNNPKIDISQLENKPLTIELIKNLFPLPPGVDHSSLKVLPILIGTTPLQENDLSLLINNKSFMETIPFVEAVVVITSGIPPAVVGIVPIGVIYPTSQLQLPRPPVLPQELLISSQVPATPGPNQGFSNLIISSASNSQQSPVYPASTNNLLGQKQLPGKPFIQQANNDLSALLQLQPGELTQSLSFSSNPLQGQQNNLLSTLFSQSNLNQGGGLVQQYPFVQAQLQPTNSVPSQAVLGSYLQETQLPAVYQNLYKQMNFNGLPQSPGVLSSYMETRMLKKPHVETEPRLPPPPMDPRYRIIGGSPATGSGAPLSNKGRSGAI